MIIAGFIITGSPVSGAVQPIDRYAGFMAGFMLIQAYPNLSLQQSAEYYKSLEKISGVTGMQMKVFIGRYKDRPDEWKKFQDRIQTILSELDNPAVNKAPAGKKAEENAAAAKPGRNGTINKTAETGALSTISRNLQGKRSFRNTSNREQANKFESSQPVKAKGPQGTAPNTKKE